MEYYLTEYAALIFRVTAEAQEPDRLIPDGQRIRVHGTDGYVELLP